MIAAGKKIFLSVCVYFTDVGEWMNGSLINNPPYSFSSPHTIHLKSAHHHRKKIFSFLSPPPNYTLDCERDLWRKKSNFFLLASRKSFLFYVKTNHIWNRLILSFSRFAFLSDTQFISFFSLLRDFFHSLTLSLTFILRQALWHTSTADDFSSTFDSPARGNVLKWTREWEREQKIVEYDVTQQWLSIFLHPSHMRCKRETSHSVRGWNGAQTFWELLIER